MEINKIDISHKDIFIGHLRKYPINGSDLSFPNIFMWRYYYRAEFINIREMLCVICRPRCVKQYAFAPIGAREPERFKAVTEDLRDIQRSRGLDDVVTYRRVEEDWLECIKSAYPENRLVIQYDRNGSDYIYLREDLVNLKGKKYDGKRNHLNNFIARDDIEFVEFDSSSISDKIKADCLDISTRWSKVRNYETDSVYYCENLANRELIENFEYFNLKGAVVKVDGKSEAFTIGGKHKSDMAIIHIEKANNNIRGLYAYINKKFTENTWPPEIKYINREEDMGIEGLRRAKESYQPIKMINKYTIHIS